VSDICWPWTRWQQQGTLFVRGKPPPPQKNFTLKNPSPLYRVFRAQADLTLIHMSHKDTEQSTIEASITLNGVTLTDSLIRWSPNEWPVCREIPVSADKLFWMSNTNKLAQWTVYIIGLVRVFDPYARVCLQYIFQRKVTSMLLLHLSVDEVESSFMVLGTKVSIYDSGHFSNPKMEAVSSTKMLLPMKLQCVICHKTIIYREVPIFVDRFTATCARLSMRHIPILPMNQYARWLIAFAIKGS
jgi:hypothetical protein